MPPEKPLVDLKILETEPAEEYHAKAESYLSSHQLIDFMRWLSANEAMPIGVAILLLERKQRFKPFHCGVSLSFYWVIKIRWPGPRTIDATGVISICCLGRNRGGRAPGNPLPDAGCGSRTGEPPKVAGPSCRWGGHAQEYVEKPGLSGLPNIYHAYFFCSNRRYCWGGPRQVVGLHVFQDFAPRNGRANYLQQRSLGRSGLHAIESDGVGGAEGRLAGWVRWRPLVIAHYPDNLPRSRLMKFNWADGAAELLGEINSGTRPLDDNEEITMPLSLSEGLTLGPVPDGIESII